jgi:3-dehydrosphinganine reductase
MNRTYWAGRHTVVTGGTSGIGLATTRGLLDAGAHVTAIGLDDDAATRLAAEPLDNLLVAPADVRREDDLSTAFKQARTRFGAVRSLICCAGITKPGYFTDLTSDDHRRHMDVNYFGTLFAVQQAIPDLIADERADGRSSITCVSSAAGFLGVFGYGAYAPTKFAVSGLCEVLRQELKPRGVTVTAVYPPDVDTPMLAGETPLKPPELRALSNGGNALSAEQVARALIEGTESGKPRVIPGASTRLLRFASGAVPGLLARYMDRAIARAQRNPEAPSP